MHGLACRGEPFAVMAKIMPFLRSGLTLTLSGLKLALRCYVEDVLIALFFLALVVAPAFAALNVFTEKNRF